MRKPRTAKGAPQPDPAVPPQPSPTAAVQSKSIKRNPEFEAAFGSRIRAARVAARMTQGDLAAAIGISFQQVQKYENGRDRVSASTLQSIAGALGIHPASFFGDEFNVPIGKAKLVREAMAVAADWQRIRNPQTRMGLARLIATLAGESQAEPEGED